MSLPRMETTTVAAFSACEITIAGDALAAIRSSNELVVTTCDDGSTFQIPQGVSFARVSLKMLSEIRMCQELAGGKSRLTL